jgi:hypothetical protein
MQYYNHVKRLQQSVASRWSYNPENNAHGKINKVLLEIGIRSAAAAVNTHRRQSSLFLHETQKISTNLFETKLDIRYKKVTK